MFFTYRQNTLIVFHLKTYLTYHFLHFLFRSLFIIEIPFISTSVPFSFHYCALYVVPPSGSHLAILLFFHPFIRFLHSNMLPLKLRLSIPLPPFAAFLPGRFSLPTPSSLRPYCLLPIIASHSFRRQELMASNVLAFMKIKKKTLNTSFFI